MTLLVVVVTTTPSMTNRRVLVNVFFLGTEDPDCFMTRVLLIGVGVAVELDDVDMSWLRWFKKKKTIFVVRKIVNGYKRCEMKI